MSFDLTQYGFNLNNREIATLTYLAIIFFALAFWKAVHDRLFAVVRAFFSPKLTPVWVIMTLYVVACVWLLASLRIWDWDNLKSTLLWWITVGFPSIFYAFNIKGKPGAFRNLVLEALTISAVLVFFIELVSFPLWIELLMLPMLVVLALLLAVAEQQPEHVKVLRLLQSIQILVGTIIIGISLTLVAKNATQFWSLNTVREFLLPFMLWALFVPFIFLLAVYMVYEEAFVTLALKSKDRFIVAYARWRALLAFGLNVDAVRRLGRNLDKQNIADKKGILHIIREIKILQKRQKNPPPVDSSEGWSPYDARSFLKEYGIVPSDYDRTLYGWWADALAVKIDEKTFADTISYTIQGSEHAATQLYVCLDARTDGDNHKAQLTFENCALSLLTAVFNEKLAEDILSRAKQADPEAIDVERIQVHYGTQNWGNDHSGHYHRYSQELTIQHFNHKDD